MFLKNITVVNFKFYLSDQIDPNIEIISHFYHTPKKQPENNGNLLPSPSFFRISSWKQTKVRITCSIHTSY